MHTAEDAARAIVASRLMTPDRMKTLWSSLGTERPADAATFIKLLVQRGLLDKGQAHLLLTPSPADIAAAPHHAPLRALEPTITVASSSNDEYGLSAAADIHPSTISSTAANTAAGLPTAAAALTARKPPAEPTDTEHKSNRILWIGLAAIALLTALGAWLLLNSAGPAKKPPPGAARNEPKPAPIVPEPVAIAPATPAPPAPVDAPQAVSASTAPIAATVPLATPTATPIATPLAAPSPTSVAAPPPTAAAITPSPPPTPPAATSVAVAALAAAPAATPTPTPIQLTALTGTRRSAPAVGINTVALGKSVGWLQGRDYAGLLGREIARQAFLVAARERFGLTTRDYWLTEQIPDAAAALQFDVVGTGYELSFLELLEGVAPRQESLRSWSYPAQFEPEPDLAEFAATCERFARTDYLDVLQQRTGRAVANIAAKSPAALPSDIEQALQKADVVSVFLALRKLHAADVAKLGATTKWAGLARGYALLGMLTEYYWHPLGHVFKARALMYGQMLVSFMPQDRSALEHRGFVYSLAGLHAAALADFDAARKQSTAADAKLTPWAAAADAHGRYDLAALEAVKKDAPEYELANLLRVVTHEYSPIRSVVNQRESVVLTTRAMDACREAAERLPSCGRVVHGMQARRNGNFKLPDEPPSAAPLRTSLYQTLPKVENLPDKVKQALAGAKVDPALGGPDEMEARAAVIEALLADELADDERGLGIELSWRVLGRILLEESFLENLPTLDESGGYLPWVDSDDKLRADRKSIGAVLKHHPFRDFALGSTGKEDEDRRIISGYLPAMDLDALEQREWKLIHSTNLVAETTSLGLNDARIIHFEATTGDFIFHAAVFHLDKRQMNQLLLLSPRSPLARAYLCEFDWPKVSQHAAQWEQESAGHPGVLTALGMQYVKAKQLDDAERCLAAAVKLEPDIRNRASLAEIYKQRGDTEKWVEQMEKLAVDSPGEAGRIRAAIAGYFLGRRELERARELAEVSGEEKEYEGMLVASAVHEVLQDWRNSEFWVEEIAKDHPIYRYQWYFWCKRTGQGNVAAANAEAGEFLKDRKRWAGESTEYSRFEIPAVIHLLREEFNEARPLFEAQLKHTSDTWSGLHAALIADAQKDVKSRDAFLKQIFETPATAYARRLPKRVELRAVAQYIIDDLAAGGRGETSRVELDKTIGGATLTEGAHCFYLLGAYLERCGQGDAANEYWRRCMLLPPLHGFSRTLSGAALTKKGIKPESYREALQHPPKSVTAAAKK